MLHKFPIPKPEACCMCEHCLLMGLGGVVWPYPIDPELRYSHCAAQLMENELGAGFSILSVHISTFMGDCLPGWPKRRIWGLPCYWVRRFLPTVFIRHFPPRGLGILAWDVAAVLLGIVFVIYPIV